MDLSHLELKLHVGGCNYEVAALQSGHYTVAPQYSNGHSVCKAATSLLQPSYNLHVSPK